MTRREAMAGGAALAAAMARAQEQSGVRRYARFRAGERTAYGLVAGETVAEFDGGLFGARRPNGKTHRLSAVELLYPVEPSKVLALARNYRSHLNSGAAPAPEPKRPEFFYKPPASLQHPGKPIVLPPDSTDVHYECEMVVVIGKRAAYVEPAIGTPVPNFIRPITTMVTNRRTLLPNRWRRVNSRYASMSATLTMSTKSTAPVT